MGVKIHLKHINANIESQCTLTIKDFYIEMKSMLNISRKYLIITFQHSRIKSANTRQVYNIRQGNFHSVNLVQFYNSYAKR